MTTAKYPAALVALIEKYASAPDLMLKGITSIEDCSIYGDQLLHFACVTGDLADVSLLLSFGVDVNARGEDGYTPLHYAAEQGHKEIVEYLLQHGSNVSLKNDSGDTALDLALSGENQSVIELLAHAEP